MKNTFILLIFTFFNMISLKSGCDFNNAIYCTTDDDCRYLHYMSFSNEFDSVFVFCKYGEFSISNESATNHISINGIEFGKYKFYTGDSIQGEDQILLQHSKTDKFIYQIGSQLKFFRELSVSIPCWSRFPDEQGHGNIPWFDKPFLIPENSILDNSEWVLQLVRVEDNKVLVNLDSVGILQNHSSIIAPYYGTNPLTMSHTVNLPDDYANLEVYLRVSSRRIGNTPYGFALRIMHARYSYSSFLEYGETNQFFKYKCSQNEINTMDSIYFDRIIAYADSFVAANNEMPENLIKRIYLADSIKGQYFMFRYYDTVRYGPLPNDYYFVNKHSENQRKINFQNDDNINLKNKLNVSVYPSLIKTEFNVVINQKIDAKESYLELFDLKGDKISSIKPVSIKSEIDKTLLTFNIPYGIASGVYSFILINPKYLTNYYGTIFKE